ncbi:carbohydrate-binding protein [Pseudomonas asplenii]|uniref:carbohydrate-binding protein n=1 Tax=Pseudomonas asplenii TaxID=53407 RepID=UPI00035D48A1|nr:carbohydrate-binding protein [Pseudomonas fuscovaginae]
MKLFLTSLFLSLQALATGVGAAGSDAVIVLLRANPQVAATRAQDFGALRQLQAEPGFAPVFQLPAARSVADTHAFERHRLDRYYRITITGRSEAEVQALLDQLKLNPLVQRAYVEPEPVSLEQGEPPRVPEPEMARQAGQRGTPPDYTGRQNYLLSPEPVEPYKLGGLDALALRRYPGGYGENVRVISDEIDHWAYDHVDLPKPFVTHWKLREHEVGHHDTASAGVMFSLDNDYGTVGFVPRAMAGYTKFGTGGLLDLGPQLKPGDVVQVGVHYSVGRLPESVCPATPCYMPVEYSDAILDEISWLTQEKGVHVVIAAANGNINLDDPYFGGRYDPQLLDSGSIYAGGAYPTTGARAWYSEYGKRVGMFSWGSNVTTTSYSPANPTTLYTHTYSGTSSANPILAGAVALMQSIANANGIGPVPPKIMRRILQETGHPLPFPDKNKPIGVQPDLKLAVEKMLRDYSGSPPLGQLASPGEVESQSSFTLKVVLSNPDARPVDYQWHTEGLIGTPGNQEEISLTAPRVDVDTPLPIAVEVRRAGQSLKLEDTLLVRKVAHQPLPPTVVIAGPSAVSAGAPVELDASGSSSSNPGAAPLRFDWRIPSGIVGAVPDGALLRFTAPPFSSTPEYRFEVTVDDGLAHAGKAHNLRILPPVIAPPVAVVSGGNRVEAGKLLNLSGTGSTGADLKYAWSANGFTPSTSANPSVSLAAPASAGPRTVVLTVTDSQNRTSSAYHAVTVTAGGGGGEDCAPGDPAAGQYRPWESGKTYVGGDMVQHNGVVWRAGWSTRGVAPDRVDAFALVSNLPVPWQSRPYVAGNQVIHQGKLYQAKYWVNRAPPGVEWTLLGDHGCP